MQKKKKSYILVAYNEQENSTTIPNLYIICIRRKWNLTKLLCK